jgi:hypothetical protein
MLIFKGIAGYRVKINEVSEMKKNRLKIHFHHKLPINFPFCHRNIPIFRFEKCRISLFYGVLTKLYKLTEV